MEIAGLILFALALNVDSFGVGVSYGIRRIRLPFFSVLIISVMSMSAISLSMLAGSYVGRFLPPAAGKHLGGLILALIGAWILYQYYSQEKNIASANDCPDINATVTVPRAQPAPLLQVQLFGYIFQILRRPHIADADLSGVISGVEAVLLGIALAMDSLVAGVAVSLLGYSIPAAALCVGVGHMLLILFGLSVGRSLGKSVFGRQITAYSGFILVILGVIKFF